MAGQARPYHGAMYCVSCGFGRESEVKGDSDKGKNGGERRRTQRRLVENGADTLSTCPDLNVRLEPADMQSVEWSEDVSVLRTSGRVHCHLHTLECVYLSLPSFSR